MAQVPATASRAATTTRSPGRRPSQPVGSAPQGATARPTPPPQSSARLEPTMHSPGPVTGQGLPGACWVCPSGRQWELLPGQHHHASPVSCRNLPRVHRARGARGMLGLPLWQLLPGQHHHSCPVRSWNLQRLHRAGGA